MLQAVPTADLETYDDCLASPAFRENLNDLNARLAFRLRRFDAPEELNGNLFYDHLTPNFVDAELDPKCEDKRRRLFEIARRGDLMVEIGVNGGHSLFLAKSANPDLRIIGIDIARQVRRRWARVDVYVPEAMRWFTEKYPGDCRFIIGDSRLEAPRLAVEYPETRIDILHVDGAKSTYFTDVVNLLPLMHPGTIIILDDSNITMVRRCARQLIRAGLVEHHPEFPPETELAHQHLILKPV